LFGSGRNWTSVARQIAARHRIITLDLRNHGNSPWAATMGYAEMAEDVCETLRALAVPRVALIGHSMGGKTAMIASLSHPAAIERLIVVDIAPVAYPPQHLGYARAMRALDLSTFRRRGDADAALASAIADPAERGFLLQNLAFDEGSAEWRVNLAAIERAIPEFAGFPEQPAGAAYRGAALFVAGERSGYLLPAHETAIRQLFPHARFARIGDAGHWLHVEQPKAFLDLVEPFLDGV
jgi:esterase